MKSVYGACLTAAALMAAAPAMAGVKEGVDAWQAGNYAKAVGEWKGPATAGDADAQFNLGQAYKLGRGVPIDMKLAEDWYRKAAIQGHEQSQANLGLILFQNGDRKGALPWIQKAADRGEPRAQYVLGTACFNGDLVPKDWPKAYALMTRAAASGLPQATTSLAQMDQYIPLAQRQQGITLARSLETTKIAAADTPPPAPSPAPVAVEPPAAKPAVKTPPPAPVKPIPVPPSTTGAPKPEPKPAPKPEPVKPEPKAIPAAAEAPVSGWRIQLGAFSSIDGARAAWAKMGGKAGLKSLQPIYTPAGAVTRLQAGPVADKAAANKTCQEVKAGGGACLPVAP